MLLVPIDFTSGSKPEKKKKKKKTKGKKDSAIFATAEEVSLENSGVEL